uniref:Small VCP interacting protein n=2 Tax=Myripristis murdjan TaxID=586833 RepID=A0A667ZFE8_9TELE
MALLDLLSDRERVSSVPNPTQELLSYIQYHTVRKTTLHHLLLKTPRPGSNWAHSHILSSTSCLLKCMENINPRRLGVQYYSMGMCLPCLGGAADDVVVTPDPETRRRQLAEAAEKRQKETAYRGVKNPETVERKRKKQEEMEKQAMTTSVSGGGGGLKWQVG